MRKQEIEQEEDTTQMTVAFGQMSQKNPMWEQQILGFYYYVVVKYEYIYESLLNNPVTKNKPDREICEIT